MTYAPAKFEVATCFYKKIHYLTLDQGHTNVAQYPLNHVTYVPTKFEVATSKGLGGDAFTRKYIIWPLNLGVKVTQNVAQYPLYHVTYSALKFEVATSHGLEGDTFTRNETDGRQTDFGTKLIYPIFLMKRSEYKNENQNKKFT